MNIKKEIEDYTIRFIEYAHYLIHYFHYQEL